MPSTAIQPCVPSDTDSSLNNITDLELAGYQRQEAEQHSVVPRQRHAHHVSFDSKCAPLHTYDFWQLNRSDLHVSSTSPTERTHITGRLSTAAAWKLNPKENHCCVHIYAKNNTLADGYDSWFLKNKSKSKLSSADIIAKINAALANNRGTLGQGNLA